MAKYANAAERRRERYRIGRLKLIYQLGGVCTGKNCNEDDPAKLEFHHNEPREWRAEKTSRWVRLARYKREAALGKVRLLCKTCNKLAGPPKVVNEEPIPD